MAQAPEDIASNFLFWNIPAHPNFPEELHGTPVVIPVAVHSGAIEDGERLIQPLHDLGDPVLDLSGPMPYTAVQASYGSPNYDRLVELKTKYDPTNLFRLNQNIPPAK